VWRLSKAGGRYNGSSAPTANFTAQHGSRGAMLTAKLESKRWTDEHTWDDDLQAQHKVAFTPEDASRAIRAAMGRGWKPKEKGSTFDLKGVDFTDYRC
jgi:hypothetical protein